MKVYLIVNTEEAEGKQTPNNQESDGLKCVASGANA
jgi:hypothetical protein